MNRHNHEPFITAKMLVRRARQQIDELHAKITAYFDNKNWPHFVEKDVDGLTDIHKIGMPPNPSAEWTHIVFEACNNLRSALDQIAFTVAILHGKPEAKAAKFPFGPTERDMLNNLAGGSKDLPSEIQALFATFRPYKGGNDTLWSLNELVNTNKYKLLIPVAMTSFQVQIPDAMNANPFASNFASFDPSKNEMTVLKVAPGGQHLKYDINIIPTIMIDHQDEMVRGQEPIAYLETIVHEIDEIGAATEAGCRRLGLLK